MKGVVIFLPPGTSCSVQEAFQNWNITQNWSSFNRALSVPSQLCLKQD